MRKVLSLVLVLCLLLAAGSPVVAAEETELLENDLAEAVLEEPAENDGEAVLEEPLETAPLEEELAEITSPSEPEASTSEEVSSLEATSGQCGDNLTWNLDKAAGVLTISGSGAMYNYNSSDQVPWSSQRDFIKEVSLPSELTSIGLLAFFYCDSLTTVNFPEGLTSIGGSAFEYCHSLNSISLPESLTSIGVSAFEHCTALSSAYFLGNAPTYYNFGTFVFDDTAADFTIYYQADKKAGQLLLGTAIKQRPIPFQ